MWWCPAKPADVRQTRELLLEGDKVRLERQGGFGPDLRFVIPVLLEAHSNLPLRDLSRLHFVDLTGPHGVDSLAQAILEDWQKRQTIRGT